MKKNYIQRQKQNLILPPNASEEFIGALEAASGQTQTISFPEKMKRGDVREALEKLLLSKRPDRGFDVLVRSAVMENVLPEVASLVDFGEGIQHKDVWAHTKQVVRQTPAKLIVRWAALLHDIGKFPTRKFETGGRVTFIGHPEVGAKMFDHISARLCFPKEVEERVRFLIAFHLRASAYEENWTDSAVRRFIKDVGDNLEDLLDLSRADITSKYPEKVKKGLLQIGLLEERAKKVAANDNKPQPLPKGLGGAIIEKCGIEPGPLLGSLMNTLRVEVEAGRLKVQADYDHYIEFLKSKARLGELK